MELTIQEGTYHRGAPHSYYDQATESIRQLYPGNQVLVSRRVGRLGDAMYSLVCYKERGTSEHVVVGGMVTSGRKSWLFSGETTEGQFVDTLVLVLETISRLGSAERK